MACTPVHLERLSLYFSPESTLVLFFDDLVHEPGSVFGKVCRHVGIDDEFPASGLGARINQRREVHSALLARALLPLYRTTGRWHTLAVALQRRNSKAVENPPMDPATRELLLETFAESNARLADLTGRNLADWSS